MTHAVVSSLKHLHAGVGGHHLEDFLHVDLGRAPLKAAVTEDDAQRLLFGNGFGNSVPVVVIVFAIFFAIVKDVFSKAGNQIAVVVVVHGDAVDDLSVVGKRQRQPPFQQVAEKQIYVRVIFLDVASNTCIIYTFRFSVLSNAACSMQYFSTL